MDSGISHRSGQSALADAASAVRELHAAIALPDAALVLFFCSRRHDPQVVAAEVARCFGDVPLMGCTTAGEIGPLGCTQHTLCGVSLGKDSFAAAVGSIDAVQDFGMAEGRNFVRSLQDALLERHPQASLDNAFALMLIDGLCMREERVSRALQGALGSIPLVGGSAGDDFDFERTLVHAGGRFAPGRAAVALVSTSVPFRTFQIQHFEASRQRLVVTAADPCRRLVSEINGLPAAQAYADAIGVAVEALGAAHFAAFPLLVLINGSGYIRSIQQVQADGGLKFFCAIEEGVVLRMARGEDMVSNMEHAFADIRRSVGEPALTIAFDCILRKLESIRAASAPRIAEVFLANRAVGLNTYGEQVRGVHVTQTLTGVAIGARHG